MNFIDTHTHLYLNHFDKDRHDVLERALDNDVTHFILPNINIKSIPQIKKMMTDFPKSCSAAMGLHPTSVDSNFENDLEICYDELKNGPYIAIGEIGIDLYWDKSYFEHQKSVFRKQVNWALELNKPIIIHSRNSFEEIFELMDNLWVKELKGVFHCFAGTADQALKITKDYGFKLGIGGVYTFKNSGLREALKDIDLKYWILETDAPYLAPVPFRSKRNESAYLRYVAEKVAEEKNESLEKIAEITTHNAKELFQLAV
jgi:TatD DNase family protein